MKFLRREFEGFWNAWLTIPPRFPGLPQKEV